MTLRFNLQDVPLKLLTYGVTLHALLILGSVFAEEMIIRRGHTLHLHLSGMQFSVALVFGMVLLYLSLYLRRGKRTAWIAAIIVYSLMLAVGLIRLLRIHSGPVLEEVYFFRSIFMPILILTGLYYYSDRFSVRSDLRSFSFSLRFIVLLMAITLGYGVGGIMIMDGSDFHQEVSFPRAVHYTIDQIGFTTDPLVPHTRRAKVFLDSLSTISVLSIGFGMISLFQPLKARLSNQHTERRLTRRLLKHFGGNSEDYFKLWPHDKFYFFSHDHTAGLAYGVKNGVALVVGDPFGNVRHFTQLLSEFDEFCRTNDWLPALIHTLPQNNELFKEAGFGLQKIGEEAVVDIEKFLSETSRDKYFRQIKNRFEKQGYTSELLKPPHSPEVMHRLTTISNEWLQQPGREERGFMMGYFSEEYMQRCNIMVLRDQSSAIQAFMNQITSFDAEEANFDLMRHSKECLGNSNDFLLMRFIDLLKEAGFKRINMGLCPLSGLDETDEERTVIDSALRFVYANGDRFYSFSGLRRFKSKYDPDWQSRYIAYKGGLRSFTRVLTALNRAMKNTHL